MNEHTQGGRGFIGYEYKSVTALRDMANLYIDCFPSFGWTLEEKGIGTPIVTRPADWLTPNKLRFKRDRKMVNKMELTRLQREFESRVNEICKLEDSKTASATIASIIVGIVGTAFLAGSVMAITLLAPINIPLSIILAVPGFIGCALPYFIYKRMSAKKDEQVTPLIEQQYDAIYETCEKANALLYK